MTGALFEAIRIMSAIALLLAAGIGLGWMAWLALGQLRHVGRPRPRLVTNERRRPPGREPTRPRPRLVWRNSNYDLEDRASEPRND